MPIFIIPHVLVFFSMLIFLYVGEAADFEK